MLIDLRTSEDANAAFDSKRALILLQSFEAAGNDG